MLIALGTFSALILLGVGAFVGHRVRKQTVAQNALVEGTAAYERGDWEGARAMLGRWIALNPDDTEILTKYAHAQLSLRPLPRSAIRQAMSAYRRVLRNNPGDKAVFERLVLLYETTGDFSELGYIARKRLEVLPDDPKALLTQAKALLYRQKLDVARAQLEALVDELSGQDEKHQEFVDACILLSDLEVRAAPPGGDPEHEEQALEWLNRAVQYSPDSALALVQRAVLPRLLAQRAGRGASETDLLASRADLESAESLETTDPRVRLMLCEQWLAHRELDRAAAQLDAAKQIDPETLTQFIVDPRDWTVAQFKLRATLLQLTNAKETGVKLAKDALDELTDRPHRAEILPAAVGLFLAGERLEDARRGLDEFLDAVKLLPSTPERAEQVAHLQAIVARAEDKPYEVIEKLELLADQPGTPVAIRSLLAEAYARTGQTGRVVKTLSQNTAGPGLSTEMAKLLARSYLNQGAWNEALDTLRSLGEAESDDVEVRVLRLSAELNVAFGRQAAQDTVDSLVSELATLRESHPERVDIRLLLAAAAETQGRLEEAEAELKRAAQECAEPLGATLRLARLYATSSRFEEAREALDTACARHGMRAAPWLALSELLVHLQQIDRAREELRQALESVAAPEEKREVVVRLASIDLVHGDVGAGITALRQIAEGDPQDVQVRALLLELPDVLRSTAFAQRLVDEIRNVEGSTGLLWRLYQARLWLAGEDRSTRQEEIEELLKYCIVADPRWATPVLVLGGAYERLGNLADAEAIYSNAFQASGSTDVADRLLALLQRQSRFADARDLLERLKQKLDEQALGARRLSLALVEGRHGEAIRELELRVAGADKDPRDLVRLAKLSYSQNGDVERAFDCLDQAAALGADPSAVARTRVFILNGEGRLEEAVAVLDESVSTQQSAEAYLLRASYYASAGQADLAERDYTQLARSADGDYGYAMLGEFYAQANRLDEAIDAWKEGLRAHPDSQALKRGLTKAWLMRNQPGDRERAREFLAELEEDLPDDADILWVRAVEKIGAGSQEELNEARKLLTQAVHALSTNAETYHGLIDLAVRLEEHTTARDLALRGLQENAGDIGLLRRRAQAELALDNLDTAREAAQSVLASDSEDLAAHEVILEVARRRQDTAALRSGLTTLRELIKADPSDEMLQLLHAQTHRALGQDDQAVTALEEFHASDAGRQSVPVLLLLQDLYRAKGDLAAARQRLDAAAALAPDHPGVLHARLLLLGAEKRFDDIVALAEENAGSNWRPDTLPSAARVLANSPAHLDDAIRLCQRATEIAPDYGFGYTTLGELAYRKGDVTRAEQAYRTALQKDPSQPDTLNNLAWILAEGRAAYDEAIVYAQEAVALRPDSPSLRDTLGFVLSNIPGKQEEARDQFRRSIELAPPGSALQAKTLLRLARVCYALDDRLPIQGYLERALAAESGESIFSPEEREEINRLLQAAPKTE